MVQPQRMADLMRHDLPQLLNLARLTSSHRGATGRVLGPDEQHAEGSSGRFSPPLDGNAQSTAVLVGPVHQRNRNGKRYRMHSRRDTRKFGIKLINDPAYQPVIVDVEHLSHRPLE